VSTEADDPGAVVAASGVPLHAGQVAVAHLHHTHIRGTPRSLRPASVSYQNPKCRLYLCLLGFKLKDWIYSQSCVMLVFSTPLV
jgi:hypothetical protein